MAKLIKSLDLWNWRGLLLGIAQALIITLCIYAVTSYKAIAQGARDGRQSLKKVEKVEQKVDSVILVQQVCERKQDVINIGIIKDVDWIKQSLIRIENKLD